MVCLVEPYNINKNTKKSIVAEQVNHINKINK